MAKTRSEINYAYAKKSYDDIKLQVKKGKKEIIKKHAHENGESLNAYISRLIKQEIGEEYGD
jgi:hypothetical protein